MSAVDYHPRITEAVLRESGFQLYKSPRPDTVLYCLVCVVEDVRRYQIEIYCYDLTYLGGRRSLGAEAHFHRPGQTFVVSYQVEPETTLDQVRLFFDEIYHQLGCVPYPGLQ